MDRYGATAPAPLRRHERRDYGLTALLAFATLALHAWQTLGLQPAAGQFAKYPVAANRLLDGSLPVERLFDYSQVYLRLCALIASFSPHPFQTLQWTQLTLVALSAAGLFLLLRRHFSRPWSMLGVAAFSLNPSLMIYGYIFEPEVLLLFLLITAVLLTETRSHTGSLIAGCAVLLSLLTRPVFVLLAVAIPLYSWLHLKGRQRQMACGCFLLPIAGGLLIFAADTRSRGYPFPPPLMNPGVVFFEGNNPLATGSGAAYPTLVYDLAEDFSGESDYQHVTYRLVARQDAGANLTPAEANRFWMTKGLNFLADEPAYAVRRLLHKAFVIGHSHRWHDIRAAAMTDRLLHAGPLPFVPLAPIVALALGGMVIGLPRWRDYLPAYVICASQTGLMLLTYASDRQRLALLPFLIFFAIIALTSLLRSRRRLPYIGLLLLLIWPLSAETATMRDNRQLWENYDRFLALIGEARSERDSGRLTMAVRTSARALAMAPWAAEGDARLAGLPIAPQALASLALAEFAAIRDSSPTAKLDRALLLVAADRPEESGSLLDELAGHAFERSINRPSLPTYYLARIAALRGDHAGAVGLMQQALAAAPGDPEILAQLAALTGDQQYADRLERYYDRLDARQYLGRAFLENSQAGRAVENLQPLSRQVPDYWKGKMYLAAALADAGRDREAVAVFLAAMRQRSEQAMFQERILPAFRRLAGSASAESSHHYWYGLALRHYGFYPEARQVLGASAAASGQAEVAEELANLEAFMRKAMLL